MLILFLITFMIGLMAAIFGLDNIYRPGTMLFDKYGEMTVQEAVDNNVPNPNFVQITSVFSYFLETFNDGVGNFVLPSSVSKMEVPM